MNYDELQQGMEDNLPIPSRDELWEAIENSNLAKYSPKQIEQSMLQKGGDYKMTLYHQAALAGHLNKIPKELLTAENLLTSHKYGENCLHIAARWGHLVQIPKEFLTERNLLQTDTDTRTCLHYAARWGHFDQIPKELLTSENLLHLDRGGYTCLDLAAESDRLDKIPLLSYKTLQELKTHFETQNSSHYKENILKTLNKKISKIELIKKSLKQDHKEIL
jgi:ankyrin repeat protein